MQILARRLVTVFAILLLILALKKKKKNYLQQWMCPNSEMEESMSKNQ